MNKCRGFARVLGAAILIMSATPAYSADIRSCGNNTYGQFGDGSISAGGVEAGGRNVPADMLMTNSSTVAAGGYQSMALKSDGTVWAWGNNVYGQLGDGTTTNRSTPVQVGGLSGVVAVAAGAYHSMALKSDGTVWAWGRNFGGSLGDGTTLDRSTPVQVLGLTGVSALAAGRWYGMALKSDGTVWAWGANGYGQLGDGTKANRSTPVQVIGLTGVSALAAGELSSMALKSDGTVWTWGYNGYGNLGDGTTTNRSTPVQVLGLTGVSALAAGYDRSMALKSNGTVWAWGMKSGDGTPTARLTPVQVLGLTGVSALAAGANHSMALKSDGTVWAWGNNGAGQLGDGTTNSYQLTPVQVIGLSDRMVTKIAAGYLHSMFVLAPRQVSAYEQWRLVHFTGDQLTNAVDNADPDGDGMRNIDEYYAGTIPTNRLSVLALYGAGVAPDSSSNFVIRWQSVSGRRYTVQAATNLLTGFTLNLRTNITATPPENVHTDSVGVAGQMFYRVKVEI